MDNHEENDFKERLYQRIDDIAAQLQLLKHDLAELGPVDEQRAAREKAIEFGSIESDNTETVVEGVFDGQNMVGPDGKIYTIPANYASKSKLVEGDIMKLTIKGDGTFLYKQIGPVERDRITGRLVFDEELGVYQAVTNEGRSYRLLTASVTYYRGDPGDRVVMLVTQDAKCKWAAVENIMEGDVDEEELLLDSGAHGELMPPHDEDEEYNT